MAIAERGFMYGPKLRHLSRLLHVSDEAALGKLMFFWDDTQTHSISDAPEEKLITFFRGRPAVIKRYFDACLAADILRKNDDGTIHVVGNTDHVETLGRLRKISVSGGLERTRTSKREQNGTFSPARSQPGASQEPARHPAVSSPASASASASEIQDQDLSSSVSNIPRVQSTASLAQFDFGGLTRRRGLKNATPAVGEIRLAYLNAYQAKYGRPCVSWGARENSQAAALLKSWPLKRVIELVALYFEWQMPGPVSDGHPFCSGYNAFTQKVHSLDADDHSPERRDDAAVFHRRLKDKQLKAVAGDNE